MSLSRVSSCVVVALTLSACTGTALLDSPVNEKPLPGFEEGLKDPVVDAGATTPASVTGGGGTVTDPTGYIPTGGTLFCQTYGTPATRGTIDDGRLAEISGLVASHANPGVFYVHNDSGDTARFFAINATGQVLAEFTLTGATAVDWEDLGLGKCGADTCLYLADIGDNNRNRDNCALFRVVEPKVDPAVPVAAPISIAFQRFPLSYADGPKNAEALLVHPKREELYIVSKETDGRPSTIYKFPTLSSAGNTLTKVVTLDVPKPADQSLTGADFHPSGEAILLRTYNTLYEIRSGPPFSAPTVAVPAATEVQGEAVAYSVDGKGFWTVSEGTPTALHQSACAP
ncbi:MAG: hypothetical protein ACT4TC_06000 [Myxococcaceae bacterium]